MTATTSSTTPASSAGTIRDRLLVMPATLGGGHESGIRAALALRLPSATGGRGTRQRAVGVHERETGSGEDLGDPRPGEVAARVARPVDDQVREVAGRLAARRDDTAA